VIDLYAVYVYQSIVDRLTIALSTMACVCQANQSGTNTCIYYLGRLLVVAVPETGAKWYPS
jgi:hypothetical protein